MILSFYHNDTSNPECVMRNSSKIYCFLNKGPRNPIAIPQPAILNPEKCIPDISKVGSLSRSNQSAEYDWLDLFCMKNILCEYLLISGPVFR